MVSAKGADLLNRTVDNFAKPSLREDHLGSGAEHDDTEIEVHRTPNNGRTDLEDGETAGARSMRGVQPIDLGFIPFDHLPDESAYEHCTNDFAGLRQAPPQRVLFQNDTTSGRSQRQPSQHASPVPQPPSVYSAANGLHQLSDIPSALANYEPKQQIPLTLRPVITLGNNPDIFKANQKALRDAYLTGTSKPMESTKGMMLPGSKCRNPATAILPDTSTAGFTGPNIYIRTLLSLQSGVMEEQEYALHHLVKISHERGDKYRFDSFPGLAESLIDKVLEISSLVSDTHWMITYLDEDAMIDEEALDGLNGTSDMLAKLSRCRKRKLPDKIETDDFARRLTLINEASLVMRNMVMLEENAEYLSKLPTVHDTITIILSLPPLAPLSELRQYFFEIAEQLTRYYPSDPEDPLFRCLMTNIDSPDRGHILSSLRAVSRSGAHLQQSVRLQDIPVSIVQRLCEWIFVGDEELRASCLDFLYQYTVQVENIETLLQTVDLVGVIKQLVRLLLHNARLDVRRDGPSTIVSKTSQPSQPPAAPPEYAIPKIPQELLEQLLIYDEPQRSSQWYVWYMIEAEIFVY